MNENNLSYLNGYLEAFSCLNNFCNHVSTFMVESLEYQQEKSLAENIAKFFPEKYKVEHTVVKDWKSEIKKACDKYFYEFRDEEYSPKIHLTDEEFIRENTCEKVIFLLNSIMQDLEAVYSLSINSSGEFYECEYHDYIFQTKTKIYFLHLGFSD